MALSIMGDPFAPVTEIMHLHGATCTPQEFHAAVNVTFHRFESEHYDELHSDMWQSLPAQINLLAEDCLRAGAPERIRMLDIGCGTGLSTDLLLQSPLGPRIESVDLVDTSPAMLARAQQRRQSWKRPGEAIEGLVESLVGHKSYNLILTCSVMHHIPDLAAFLGAITALEQNQPGALFLHLQDPNKDYLNDAALQERSAAVPKSDENSWAARLKPARLLGRIRRELSGQQGQDYLSQTNRELLRQGFVNSPLSAGEIFAITDIHATEGDGISVAGIREWLADYDLVVQRSYGFHGVLWSHLPADLRASEEQLIREGALNGMHLEAAWRRRS